MGITSYEAVKLYKGSRIIESKGEGGANWRVHKLVSYCALGIVAGILGGLLGLGGGFIMGPVFLEMGLPPQVHFMLQHLISSAVEFVSFESYNFFY